jgi:hypothetical protein
MVNKLVFFFTFLSNLAIYKKELCQIFFGYFEAPCEQFFTFQGFLFYGAGQKGGTFFCPTEDVESNMGRVLS